MLRATEGGRMLVGLSGTGEARHSHPLIAVREFLIRVTDALGTWADRARERRHLLALDDRMLADIARDRSRVQAEAAKPFWRR
jgi:uncharacterized protein YjiS (DUF1127 family)